MRHSHEAQPCLIKAAEAAAMVRTLLAGLQPSMGASWTAPAHGEDGALETRPSLLHPSHHPQPHMPEGATSRSELEAVFLKR